MDYIEMVVPNSLQMGWCKIPQFFSESENALDIVERLRSMEILPHKVKEVMLQRIPRTDLNKHSEVLVTLLEVYVQDFIAMSNGMWHSHLEKCHGRCCMGSMRSYPHSKSRAIMGLTWLQRKNGWRWWYVGFLQGDLGLGLGWHTIHHQTPTK